MRDKSVPVEIDGKVVQAMGESAPDGYTGLRLVGAILPEKTKEYGEAP